MSSLPRLAVGSIQPSADAQFFTWGLFDVLARSGVQVQSFASQARFVCRDAARAVTGRCQRHLDSWIMSAALCRELLSHGAAGRDLAVVEGRFGHDASASGGKLETLCEWLDLPRLGVLDVSLLTSGHLPQCAPALDGVFLDRCPSPEAAVYWQTAVEMLWGVKVLGVLEEAAALRAEAARTPLGQAPSAALVREIGTRLERCLKFDELQTLADRPWDAPRGQLYSWHTCQEPLVVAVAYDEAFHCYFPDVIDLLELSGAHVRDFSPLKDPELPEGADLVCFGCGQIERFAARLAANHCLKQALWRHVSSGGRVYGEGAGAAYLCREMLLPLGQRYSACGLVPAVAQFEPGSGPALPVEARLAHSSWLGGCGSPVRGYRNPHWSMLPVGQGDAGDSAATDLLVSERVVASRLHLDFAASPRSFARLLTPLHSSSLAVAR